MSSSFLGMNVKILKKFLSHVSSPSKLLVRLKERYFYLFWLKLNVRHIHGPRKILYAQNELIVLCVVRNGELYLKSFVEHHQKLGIKHIVFLDNGSTDSTIDIAKQYEGITILQTDCPYRIYETVMKRYLTYRFSKKRWSLFCDIDELFDYPYSSHLSLERFLNYLNQNSYTAVVSQMLDLFSNESLANVRSNPDDSIREKYIFFDVTNLSRAPYPYPKTSSSKVCWHWGGIRRTVFGTENYLTKAALVFVDSQINLFVDCHHVWNANIADITCVLYHYPFLSHFYSKVVDAVKTDRYAVSASSEYEMYWKRLEVDPDLTLISDKSQQIRDTNSLVDQDFLVVSKDYLSWLKVHERESSSLV